MAAKRAMASRGREKRKSPMPFCFRFTVISFILAASFQVIFVIYLAMSKTSSSSQHPPTEFPNASPQSGVPVPTTTSSQADPNKFINSSEFLRIIRKHISFPEGGRERGSEICGNWHKGYKQLHRQMRAGDLKPKYVTFQPSRTGLGDNLLGLVSAFVAALVSERAFILADSDLASAFEPVEIDWRQRDDVPMEIDSISEAGVREGSVLFVRWMNSGSELEDMVRFPRDLLRLFSIQLGPASNIIIESNGGILTRIMEDKGYTFQLLERMGLASDSAFGCILRYLVRPKEHILLTVAKPMALLLQHYESSVCIHTRASDQLSWNTTSGESLHITNVTAMDELFGMANQRLLRCANEVSGYWIPAGKRPLWLFLASIPGLARAIKLQYENTKIMVVTSPNVPMHPQFKGPAALPSAIADWFLLTACKNYVISESGFSKTAAAYNVNRPRYFLLQEDDARNFSNQCDPRNPTSLSGFKLRSGL